MKMKCQAAEITHPRTGKRVGIKFPHTLEQALIENTVKYSPLLPCERHPHVGDPDVYVKTGIKTCCAAADAATAFDDAMKKREPFTSHGAYERGIDYYWKPGHHPQCGHVGKYTLTGKCYTCQKMKVQSPRQAALAAGQMWYTPLSTDPCPRGHFAPRRVATGACQQCEEENKAARGLRPLPFYKDPANATMVISKKDAKALGLTAYRTGEPCSQGHTGFRYTTTGNCIDCLRGK